MPFLKRDGQGLFKFSFMKRQLVRIFLVQTSCPLTNIAHQSEISRLLSG